MIFLSVYHLGFRIINSSAEGRFHLNTAVALVLCFLEFSQCGKNRFAEQTGGKDLCRVICS